MSPQPVSAQVREVEVVNENGIHVRPSSQIVELARGFSARMILRNGEIEADCRSVIGLLQLQASQGCRLTIEADGDDAADAVAALAELFASRFGFDA